MVVSCAISPAVFAALYEFPRRAGDFSDVAECISGRLDELDLDEEWRTWAAGLYARMAGAQDPYWHSLEEVHARLAAWVWVGARQSTTIPLFAEDYLNRVVADRLAGDRPRESIVLLHGWCLGAAIHPSVRDAAVPPIQPDELDVSEAYYGLLEYLVEVLEILSVGANLGEMRKTAVVWRLGALVDGMGPADKGQSLQTKFWSLFNPLKRYLADAEFRQLADSCKDLGEVRNGLSHLLPAAGGMGFRDARVRCDDFGQLMQLVKAATTILFDHLGDALFNTPKEQVSHLVGEVQGALEGFELAVGP